MCVSWGFARARVFVPRFLRCFGWLRWYGRLSSSHLISCCVAPGPLPCVFALWPMPRRNAPRVRCGCARRCAHGGTRSTHPPRPRSSGTSAAWSRVSSTSTCAQTNKQMGPEHSEFRVLRVRSGAGRAGGRKRRLPSGSADPINHNAERKTVRDGTPASRHRRRRSCPARTHVHVRKREEGEGKGDEWEGAGQGQGRGMKARRRGAGGGGGGWG